MTSPLIITFRGVPLQFIQNHCGRVYSLCHLDDATRFPDEAAARVALVDWNLRGNGACQIVSPSPIPPSKL